jgi:hypothetical protein
MVNLECPPEEHFGINIFFDIVIIICLYEFIFGKTQLLKSGFGGTFDFYQNLFLFLHCLMVIILVLPIIQCTY